MPSKSLTLTNAAGSATIDVPASTEFLGPAVADFAAALERDDRPAADGEHALHIPEAPVAAYASAAARVPAAAG